jgi:hypothetical protein
MSSPPDVANQENAARPPRSTRQSLTPPSTDMKPSAEARRVVALFRRIQAGEDTPGESLEFQLDEGGFDQIQSLLEQNPALWGFVDDKIRLVDFRANDGHD